MFLFTFMSQIVRTIFDYAAKLHLCQKTSENSCLVCVISSCLTSRVINKYYLLQRTNLKYPTSDFSIKEICYVLHVIENEVLADVDISD